MPDINREASEFWNSLKPMIDEEIKAQTRGMVQRRKMKVTTAPSLNTNKIGVTEPFGTEMFIPFTTNLISATVGDVVWVEFMYGMTNAFASMFASADEKDWDVAGDLSVVGNAGIGGNLGVSGATSLQNTTVNGVLDITPRRCSASLSSAGWYRVLKISGNRGAWSSAIDFCITRAYNNTNNEVHSVRMLQTYTVAPSFVNEASKSNALNVAAIRYTVDNDGIGYVDIRYDANSANTVMVDFIVHTAPAQQETFTAEQLQSVAASPSGETVLTEYTFEANTNGVVTSSFSTSKGSVDAYRSGDMVTVTFVGNSTTWTEDEVFMTIADGIRPALSIDAVAYIGRQAVVVRINQNGNIVLWIGSTLTGNQRLYFSATYPILH